MYAAVQPPQVYWYTREDLQSTGSWSLNLKKACKEEELRGIKIGLHWGRCCFNMWWSSLWRLLEILPKYGIFMYKSSKGTVGSMGGGLII